MTSHFRPACLALAFVATAVPANAQTWVYEPDSPRVGVYEPRYQPQYYEPRVYEQRVYDPPVYGSRAYEPVATVPPPPALTPAQRTTIYRTVTRERVQAAPPSFAVTLGARVPQTVELREIPSAVVAEVPSVRPYRYMVVNNEVVLVDPATSEVIEIIRQ